MSKSTVDQIRERFDGDVERFSNLETGQSATIDAALSLALIAEAASRVTPRATSLLDVGCGAGNYTLKVLERLPNLDVTLIDLSRPMLDPRRRTGQSSHRRQNHPRGRAMCGICHWAKGVTISSAPPRFCTIFGRPKSGATCSPNFTNRSKRAVQFGFRI